jgi:type III pantothenate kinase
MNMSEIECDFVVDSGNSCFKVGKIENSSITEVKRYASEQLSELLELISGKKIIISHVGSEKTYNSIKKKCTILFRLVNDMNFPFQSEYQTMESWGVDRACNMVAAHEFYPNQNVLVVDIGTCIKFDLMNSNGVYQGGSISPGIKLRFLSLHEGTAKLPLLDPTSDYNLIGKSTNESITNGIMKGLEREIKGLIKSYKKKNKHLRIIVTGGDLFYFDFKQKSNIFADENLTLKGLYQLYLFNA